MCTPTTNDEKAARILAALPHCSSDELDALLRMVRAIETRRAVLPAIRRTELALKELRDATTYTPRRPELGL